MSNTFLRIPGHYFNPLSREGSDFQASLLALRAQSISIHAPAKGATKVCGDNGNNSLLFQSTLPRRERRGPADDQPENRNISIHAPAKGATLSRLFQQISSTISIHAPAKGATTLRRSEAPGTLHFNPRSREGSDDYHLKVWTGRPRFQSTLPRRERHRLSEGTEGKMYFNPRSREGSDNIATLKSQRKYYFNPRSREGSDTRVVHPAGVNIDFNPRSREGSDRATLHRYYATWTISIHAPAKGATLTNGSQGMKRIISIHAPAKGATYNCGC